MGRTIIGTGLFAASLVLSGCTHDDPTNEITFFPIVYTDLTEAATMDVDAPMTRVFRDETEWTDFWRSYTPTGTPVPAVDFTDEMLIGVFWGGGYSGCIQYVDAIRSVRVRIEGVNTLGVIEVDVGTLPLLGDCLTIVYPLQVVRVDATSTAVEFVGFVP